MIHHPFFGLLIKTSTYHGAPEMRRSYLCLFITSFGPPFFASLSTRVSKPSAFLDGLFFGSRIIKFDARTK
jgi:hypothetical protein